jgi:hypothetical protein
MIYVFDTSSFRVLRHYYRGTFESIWLGIEELANNGLLVSTREVFNELQQFNDASLILDWAKNFKSIFATPSNEELAFVRKIFEVEHFAALISAKSVLKGTPVADPFVIAAAWVKGGTVVTQESLKPNAAKIPNVCDHFGVPLTDLEGFMSSQNWKF